MLDTASAEMLVITHMLCFLNSNLLYSKIFFECFYFVKHILIFEKELCLACKEGCPSVERDNRFSIQSLAGKLPFNFM